MLREIGRQLDSDIYPIIKNGGVVVPSTSAEYKPLLGEKETTNESQRQGRPETGPRTGTTRGQRQAERGGAPNPTPSFWGADLQVKYEGELSSVREAYPNTRVWHQSEGLWLLSESTLLAGLRLKALFLTGIPFVRTRVVQSWGFWAGMPLTYPVWIGPRHTNFPYGSVCAFCPSDKAWSIGDPIVRLLDLYTLWAFRHLHLQTFGRWPGKQAAQIPYERITELKEDEFCGCDQSNKLYGDCCREKDLTRNLFDEYNYFLLHTGGTRRPPESVMNFIRLQKDVPRISDLLPEPQLYPKRFLFGWEQLALRWMPSV
jgi:hypothetical protein